MFKLGNTKLTRKKLVVLLIFGLVLGLAIYFFYSPANVEPESEGTPEYIEMSNALARYGTLYDVFVEKNNDVIDSGNSISTDNMIEESELTEFENLLEQYIDASRDIKDQSDEVERLINLYAVNFKDPDALISELRANEKFINDNINVVVMFIGLLRGEVQEQTHNGILNDLSVQLINIRDN